MFRFLSFMFIAEVTGFDCFIFVIVFIVGFKLVGGK
jgi:hypothetical protein